jgi:hypothetical protein
MTLQRTVYMVLCKYLHKFILNKNSESCGGWSILIQGKETIALIRMCLNTDILLLNITVQ